MGIALGYIAVRMAWFHADGIKALGRYTVLIGMPALLFRGLSHQTVGSVLNVDYLAVYALGAFSSMGIIFIVARLMLANPVSFAGLQSLGASNSNSLFIGYPIATLVLGPIAAVALALCMLVENILVMPLALTLADAGNAQGQHGVRALLVTTLRSIARNPMIWAIGAGLAVSASGVPVPAVLETSISMVASSTSPVALFVIGGSLVGLSLSGMQKNIALIVGGKLVLHPLCVLLWLWVFPPVEPLLRSAAVLFAAMPMMSIYPVVAQRYGHEKLCSAALLGATVASFFTIAATIALLPAAWLPLK